MHEVSNCVLNQTEHGEKLVLAAPRDFAAFSSSITHTMWQFVCSEPPESSNWGWGVGGGGGVNAVVTLFAQLALPIMIRNATQNTRPSSVFGEGLEEVIHQPGSLIPAIQSTLLH